MLASIDPKDRDRIKSAAAVVGLHVLLGYALVTGLAETIVSRAAGALKTFDISEPPPPPEAREEPKAEDESPPEEAKAMPLVVPEPIVKIELPPAVTAVLEPDAGEASADGSANAGQGNGNGSGLASGPRLVGGRIRNRDYPRAASRANAQGTVVAIYDVDAEGRPRNCGIRRSSGNAALDATTCRLIERRFRYEPARDAAGRPVASEAGWQQVWWLEDR